jgi:hypothetical protein
MTIDQTAGAELMASGPGPGPLIPAQRIERRTRTVLRSQLPAERYGRRPDDPQVTVLIPTLNEARNLPHVFERLPDTIAEVLVVDGRSTDDTIAVARALRPDVRIIIERRRGKGSAVLAGFRAARGDIIVMLDADGSADPQEIPLFVRALVAGADFAKGSRYLPGGGSDDLTRARSLGNRTLTWIVNAVYGARYTDLCYGYNALWADILPRLDFHCSGFEVETLVNLRAAKLKLAVSEVPSIERERLFGESNLSATRDGLRVLRTIVSHIGPVERGMAHGPHRTAALTFGTTSLPPEEPGLGTMAADGGAAVAITSDAAESLAPGELAAAPTKAA